ncbi:response regulator [Lyticum sinuosum]|uniref:DNA-binding response regulator n=1 Tax=Lyticum sinuosum TaxID=1332059 RepID=A0AAE4VJH1_9RICK|nr:response regulator [Lyticum sinuosum]MDZ5761155.1 DNA-binding response regulator [Lyticum sinuosum]
MKTKPLKFTVLLVEDDYSISSIISYILEKEGYKVISISDGGSAVEVACKESPDLILLDWMLPRKSGIDICTELRDIKETSNIPIIIISSKGDSIDKVTGLERGADDYMTKPFSSIELLARIRAVVRRIRPAFGDKKLVFNDIEMDLSSYSVSRSGKNIKLSFIEFQILRLLMESPEKVFSRDDFIIKIWDPNSNVDYRTVDVHITRLRKALIDACPEKGNVIETIRMAGYKLRSI